MIAGVEMGRRDFLKIGVAAGGGLVLGFGLTGPGGGRRAAVAGGPFAPSAFLRIGADESVTVVVGKAEMGQGVYTSLPMLVAEELECDWARVRVEAAPVDPAYNHTAWGSQMTGGSTSVWSSWEQLSRAGAAARLMLVSAAADTWGVAAAQCRAEQGFVVHGPSGRRLSYGTLARAAAALPVPEEVRLKDPSEWKVLGRPRPRLDTPEKTDGSARFGIDVGRPGLLTAVIARPPVFGAKPKGFDPAKAEAVPGVRAVVAVDAGVAVVADGFWAAQQGREALEVSWDEGGLATLSTDGLREEFARLAATPGAVARKDGDAEAALARAARHIEATYEVPYLAHAPMEPLNCVAEVGPDRCEVWTGTQFQTVDRDAAARAAGLPPEKVRLHTAFLGGGFGRRGNPASDFVTEAVQVAKAVGRPVKVIWTREDDVRGGYYRPMWYDRIAAALDQKGLPLAWRHTIVGQSILAGTPFAQGDVDATSVEGAKDLPYAVPNVLVDLHSPSLAIPVLWWRSVGHSHTAFVVEGFIDELAHAAGQDPYDYRRGLLGAHPRLLGVLERAAGKAGWGEALPEGRARGIAVHASFGSFAAQVAEVSVEKGRVRVHRVVCAVDCGRFVNPDTIEAQMESGIAYGLSAVLHGEITFRNGRVRQGNFDDYPVLRLREMPRVEVHLVASGEAPGGVGEPGVPPIAPAVVNAVYAATGKRLRRLPIRREDLA
jgi:isoquinoline 1-oxidoreductase beta subunit